MKFFWERCVAAKCVIVPVRLYSQYGVGGNIDEQHFEGIKFTSVGFHRNEAIGPDYYIDVDERQYTRANYYDTPEEVLAQVEKERGHGRSAVSV